MGPPDILYQGTDSYESWNNGAFKTPMSMSNLDQSWQKFINMLSDHDNEALSIVTEKKLILRSPIVSDSDMQII